ncbi:MAG TPA: ABC transporter ATP-binding protein [Candidatus Limnocylindria bacterium]|nr:ABC transporter ATP-binding protein [Candidatus Limnocylindria bacterium]
MRPVIVVEHLSKRFGRLQAVDELSFTVGDGEIFGLLGPNGAGKTTTVRMLSGLVEPSAGRATINGLDLAARTEAVRAQTGILTELPGLHDRLTARQNLAYYARLYGLRGRAQRDAVTRHLALVGMSDHADRRVGGFSKGMRQKVAIARALLHDPQVIYLDEPTSGLDPSAARQVREIVADLRDAGRSIIICTHNLDEAERLCDRIGIMRGTLLSVGTPAALRRLGRRATTRIELVGPRGPESFLETVARLPIVAGARADGRTLLVEVGDPRGDNPEVIRALVADGARILSVREEAASLEEVYLGMVGSAPSVDIGREAVA